MTSINLASRPMWMDNARIGTLIGNIQEETRSRRGPFEDPNPWHVEQLRETWELKQQGLSFNDSCMTITPSAHEMVFSLTESDDDYNSAQEGQLENMLRAYTSAVPKIINPGSMMLRSQRTLGGFLHAQPASKSWRKGPPPFPRQAMGGADSAKTVKLGSFFGGRPQQTADLNESRATAEADAANLPAISRRKMKVVERPWRATNPPPKDPPPPAEPPRSASCQPRLGATGKSKENVVVLPDYSFVKPRVQHKRPKEPVLDYSFSDLRSVKQLLTKEPRSGTMWVEVTVVKNPKTREQEIADGDDDLAKSRGNKPWLHKEQPSHVKESKLVASGIKLSHNQLSSLEGWVDIVPVMLKSYERLQWVDLSFNSLSHVPNELMSLPLIVLYLHSNNIGSLSDLEKIRALADTLVTLSLNENPVTLQKDYHTLVISWLPKLRSFDFSTVTAADHEYLDPRGKHIAHLKASIKPRPTRG